MGLTLGLTAGIFFKHDEDRLDKVRVMLIGDPPCQPALSRVASAGGFPDPSPVFGSPRTGFWDPFLQQSSMARCDHLLNAFLCMGA